MAASHVYVLRYSIFCLKDSLEKMKLRYVWVEESARIAGGIHQNDVQNFTFKAKLLSLNEASILKFSRVHNTRLEIG